MFVGKQVGENMFQVTHHLIDDQRSSPKFFNSKKKTCLMEVAEVEFLLRQPPILS